MTDQTPYQPVIILGAGRSGTNVLRDVLTSLPDFETWPCDEIQPIWRHGNLLWPNDTFTAEMATEKTANFIRKQFLKQWNRSGNPKYLVEKTCANTLRVPFIDAVFPSAKYVEILRHGADVVKSAEKRWRGDLELPGFSYFLAKARFIPIVDFPVYLWSFVAKRIGMITGKSKRISVWGPRFPGMEKLQDTDLQKICARQWHACTEASRKGLENVPDERKITIRYEDFIRYPARELEKILGFMGTPYPDQQIKAAVQIVRTKNDAITHAELSNETASEIIAAGLTSLGYEDKT